MAHHVGVEALAGGEGRTGTSGAGADEGGSDGRRGFEGSKEKVEDATRGTYREHGPGDANPERLEGQGEEAAGGVRAGSEAWLVIRQGGRGKLRSRTSLSLSYGRYGQAALT